MTTPISGRRVALRAVLVVAAVVAVLYGLYVGYLFMMADEGDRPPASTVTLPQGARVISQDVSCGSGGCATQLVVEPPAGITPARLAEIIGATPQLRVAGNLLDPRTVSVMAWPKETTLGLSLDYSSQEYVP
ncbi:hypothetical protein B0I12_001951 [Microbacterium hydrothermale]|uniref:hypothetical protein n=1 Tax=Microbacterium hydrothermale TaxID=857427 RepID=UPI0022277AB8|nr:hypothetical protein [Microbacterium hydrothermale]MCW2164816.1 hypothetical protein [Microbacterium hydrothermale]